MFFFWKSAPAHQKPLIPASQWAVASWSWSQCLVRRGSIETQMDFQVFWTSGSKDLQSKVKSLETVHYSKQIDVNSVQSKMSLQSNQDMALLQVLAASWFWRMGTENTSWIIIGDLLTITIICHARGTLIIECLHLDPMVQIQHCAYTSQQTIQAKVKHTLLTSDTLVDSFC